MAVRSWRKIFDPSEDGNGFALPAALLAMVVIGAIVTGGFYAASQEDRVSQSVVGSRDAFYIAEQGIERVVGQWTLLDFPTGARWDSAGLEETVERGSRTIGTYEVTTTKLDSLTYFISSTGRTQNHGHVSAVRRLGQVVRASLWNVPMGAALYVNGGLTVTGNAYIQGNDSNGGECNGGAANVAGVVSSDTSQVDINMTDHVIGDPPVQEDTTMTTTSLLEFGEDHDFDSLAQQAEKRYVGETPPTSPLPVSESGVCSTGVKDNWGDPTGSSACSDYYPMVYIEGDAHFSNGRGQGVLLVNGDLQMTGNFEYDGIVIVKGSISSTGNGNHIDGVVLVNNGAVDLGSDASFTAGSSVLQYSSCSAQNARYGHVRMQPIATRSWFDLSAAGAH